MNLEHEDSKSIKIEIELLHEEILRLKNIVLEQDKRIEFLESKLAKLPEVPTQSE